MTPMQWEYASIVWSNTLKKVTKADPEYERLSPELRARAERDQWEYCWWREQKYSIWLPSSTEAEIRIAWVTGDTDYATRLVDILNELGAEGWELASQVVSGSAMGVSYGHETAGYPIETRTLLKRQIA
jgi:hypothetical protein